LSDICTLLGQPSSLRSFVPKEKSIPTPCGWHKRSKCPVALFYPTKFGLPQAPGSATPPRKLMTLMCNCHQRTLQMNPHQTRIYLLCSFGMSRFSMRSTSELRCLCWTHGNLRIPEEPGGTFEFDVDSFGMFFDCNRPHCAPTILKRVELKIQDPRSKDTISPNSDSQDK
jgi:hypothetical protein